MMRLTVKNLGPIRSARVEFGDLTVLVGPQASGKSLFLEVLKLVVDTGAIKSELKKEGRSTDKWEAFLATYFGMGMEGIWSEKTQVLTDNKKWSQRTWRTSRATKPKVYYIPAQRLVAVETSWPKTFRAFDSAYPYVVRSFSEHLRQYLERAYTNGRDDLFPVEGRFKADIRDAISRAIFKGAPVVIEQRGDKQTLVLKTSKQDSIAVGSWSSGQREFMPLLLQMSDLLPAAWKPKRGRYGTIIIEEPEMGLHPAAIGAAMLLVLDALARSYKVVLSTHSTDVVNVVWAMREIKENRASPEQLLRVVGIESGARADTVRMAEAALKKKIAVHYFQPKPYYGRIVTESKDISSLDPAHPDDDVGGWGGLTDFNARTTSVVAQINAPRASR